MLNFLKSKILGSPDKYISYAEYMQITLYHPKWGYYMKKGEKIGRNGDFITTSNFSDIYGSLICKWFFKLWREKGINPAVCEIGAGNGRFAKAFITQWNQMSSQPLYYYILEDSPYHRELQQKTIPFDDTIIQIKKLDDIHPFQGMVFSNELFDALPVHVIERKEGQLMEVMVTIDEDDFVEKSVPLKNNKVIRFIEKYGLTLNENQRIEVPLAMDEMILTISNIMEKGIVLTVDYGYTNEEWKEPIHRDGSLRGYYRHKQVADVLRNPGEMDITSHVHFDSLIQRGEEAGLRLVKMLRQDEFLLAIGILEELKDHDDPNPFSEVSRRNRAIRSLVMPSGISPYFHAIIQQKGLNVEIQL